MKGSLIIITDIRTNIMVLFHSNTSKISDYLSLHMFWEGKDRLGRTTILLNHTIRLSRLTKTVTRKPSLRVTGLSLLQVPGLWQISSSSRELISRMCPIYSLHQYLN